ncbi:MAG TPA: hypothetical protein ENH34_06510 [Phycisphaerales bacterium]|nr:hypothetical protein [Phycisphaerales bacterium]
MLLIIAISILFFYAILGFKKPGIALITMPVACFLLAYAAVSAGASEIILFTPVIVVVTLAATLMSGREPDSEQWPQKLVKWILIGFAFLLLSATAIVVFGPGGFWGFLFFALFIGSLTSYGLASQRATAAYIISTIGSSIRQNLPLPMALESAASGQDDKRSRILRSIKKWLVQGYSLSESIKRGYPKCPGYAVAMITAAERINQLPFAIKSIEADITAKADESRKIRPFHPFYPVILIIFMFFIVLALMQFVMPQLKSVLEEMFEGPLPAATQFLMRSAGFVAYEIGSLLLIAVVFIIFVVVPVSIRIKFRPRRPDKPYLISRISDFVKWHLPVSHWFENNHSMIQVVEILRLSLNSGCTVNEAIANTLSLDVNNCFKERLRKWLVKVEAGNNISTAVKESKLGNSLAWAFDQQANQDGTLSILETLESFYRSNYSYRVNLARFIIGPCVIIIMGAMVGFVVYAIFSPVVAIINLMSNLVTP